MMMITSPKLIGELAGGYGRIIEGIDYDDTHGRQRTYSIKLASNLVGFEDGHSLVMVEIDRIAFGDEGDVHVTVGAEWDAEGWDGGIARFKLSRDAYPTPATIDQEAIRRALLIAITDRLGHDAVVTVTTVMNQQSPADLDRLGALLASVKRACSASWNRGQWMANSEGPSGLWGAIPEPCMSDVLHEAKRWFPQR